MAIDKVLYTAQASATGGRDGRVVSSDGALDLRVATPRELGGAGGEGTNPEQLFRPTRASKAAWASARRARVSASGRSW